MKLHFKSVSLNDPAVQLTAIPCIFFFIVTILSIGRLISLSANAWDLAVFDQYFWFLSRSDIFADSSFLGWSALADHLSFILIPLSTSYLIIDSPAVLIFMQSIFLASAIYCLGYLSYRVESLSLNNAKILQLSFALSLPLWNAGINDFHTDSLFPVLVICLYFSITRNAWPPTIVFLGFLLIVRDTGWFLAGITGVACLLRSPAHGRRLSIFVIFAAAAWAWISASALYPFFYSEKYHHYSHYAHILSLLNGNLSTSDFIKALTTSNLLASFYWIGLIAAPFLFLCSWPRSTILILAAVASSMPYILSSEANHINIIYHYGLSVVPFLALAAARGCNDSVAFWHSRKIYGAQLFIAALALSSHSLILPNYITAYRSMPEYLSFMSYARALPAHLKIMASNGLAPLVSNRKFVDFPLKHPMADPSAYHEFPQDFSYLILDQTNPGFGSSPDRNDELVNKAIEDQWTCTSKNVAHHEIVECLKTSPH